MNLIPRDEVRSALIESLRDSSVILFGPRRVGKSTLLDGLVEAPPHGHVVVRLDLEGFLARPIEDLADQVRQRLEEAKLVAGASPIERVEGFQAGGVGLNLREANTVTAWDRLRGDLIEAVGNLREQTVLVVALDEVPWWIDAIVEREGAAAGRAALASLRRLRQDPAIAERVRFVLTGSIGLAGLAAAIGASAELNDLATVLMNPMSLAQGATLFETEVVALARPCSSVAALHAARLAGGSPHWIKRLAAATGSGGATDVASVEAAAESLLVPALRKQFADEGHEHFRRRHADVFPALVAMLEALAGGDEGQPAQGALNAGLQGQPGLGHGRARECLYLLIDGFYLAEEPGGTLRWVNPLFRRWWLKYGGA